MKTNRMNAKVVFYWYPGHVGQNAVPARVSGFAGYEHLDVYDGESIANVKREAERVTREAQKTNPSIIGFGVETPRGAQVLPFTPVTLDGLVREEAMRGGLVSYAQFMAQFCTPGVIAAVERAVGRERIVEAVRNDPYGNLNNIPLAVWDAIRAQVPKYLFDHTDAWHTSAMRVGIFKAAARVIAARVIAARANDANTR